MRPILILAPFLLAAATAQAEPLKLAKGMWSVTSDIYMSVLVYGEAVEVPSEHSAIDECWSTDEEVTIDENIASYMGECTAGDSVATAYSFDIILYCDFDGVPMEGSAEFAVSKGGGSFSGRMFLSGSENGAEVTAEALMIGHNSGTCTAPN
ncbi:hypothetical protein ACQKH5_03720 [Hyphomonas sp. NPDC076900]|uniref:hypothetical protein n=1 Tax=unclassified Hyphomonas TaxID=2630699 RepID=UPI003D0801B9